MTAVDHDMKKERRQALLLPADVIVAVLDADDEMAVVGGICDRHAGILDFPAVDGHPVVLGQLPPVLQPGDQVVPVEELPDPVPVLGINQPADVPAGGFKEYPFLLPTSGGSRCSQTPVSASIFPCLLLLAAYLSSVFLSLFLKFIISVF